MTCDPENMVQERIERVATRYRESPRFLRIVRTYLTVLASIHEQVCDLPSKFDISSATGDQLTMVGKRLGWPRCHCVCESQPVFGFECQGYTPNQPLSGFCDPGSTWAGCGEFGVGEVCIVDDEVYRGFLYARRRQFMGLFGIESLEQALVELFGSSARVLDAGRSRVVIAPGRDLTSSEEALLQLYPRVMPIALGVRVLFHFDETEVFGFGSGWGGFCEELFPDGTSIVDDEGNAFETEFGVEIWTGPLTTGAPWMCEIDVNPYGC
jgi:hypothetical protein